MTSLINILQLFYTYILLSYLRHFDNHLTVTLAPLTPCCTYYINVTPMTLLLKIL